MTPQHAIDLSTLPAPLVPADCDLRDFEYMPIYINRLRKSETWINARYSPELGYWSMNLWLESWHSVPAGSLEASDIILAETAMCDRKRWAEVREDVMRGWVLCSDGRYYHPVVSQCAREAWDARTRYRSNLQNAREAKARKTDQRRTTGRQSSLWPVGVKPEATSADKAETPQRISTPPEPADASPLLPPQHLPQSGEPQKTAVPSMIGLKSEVVSEKIEKKGSLRSPSARARESVSVADPDFDSFMAKYPVPMFPRIARGEWDAAIERGATAAEILDGLDHHRFAENPRYIAHPARWLAGDCWRSPGVPREMNPNPCMEVLLQAADRRAGLTPEGWKPRGFMAPEITEIACA
jgi:hypothetical protein